MRLMYFVYPHSLPLTITIYRYMIIDMPHVSRNRLHPKTQAEIDRLLHLVLGKLNHADIEVFLTSLISETEKTMLSKRLAVAILLIEGVEKQNVAGKLHVTHETVNRIYSSLLLKPKGFHLANSVIEKDKVLQAVKTGLLKLTGYVVRAAGGHVKPEIF